MRLAILIAAIAASVCPLCAQTEPPPAELTPAESFQLGLEPSGSLVDALFFKHSWAQAFPGESCVILRQDGGKEAKGPIADAVAVYSKGGRLYVRSLSCGTLSLPGTAPSSLVDSSELRQSVEKTLKSAVRRPFSSEEPPLEQMLVALARMHSRPAGKTFPVGLGRIRVVVRRGEEQAREEREYLIIDYDNLHYAYRPGAGGTWATPLPRDNTLGYPLPCVRGGDLIDAVLYLQALRKKEPAMKARLGGLGTAERPATKGLACVLMQQGRELWVHQLYLGDVSLANVSGDDFENESLLCQKLVALYTNGYRRVSSSRTETQVRSLSLQYDDMMDAFSVGNLMALPGDTDSLQLSRATETLRNAGVEILPSRGDDKLRFAFDGLKFVYSPSKGASFLPETKIHRPVASISIGKLSVAPSPPKARSDFANRYVPSKEELASLAIKADAGEKAACKDLGIYLMDGIGTQEDPQKAIPYLTRAADAGDGECAIMLARFFDAQTQSDETLAKTRKYYLLAAKAAFPVAMYNYGAMLYSGRGGERNLREGLAWLIVAGHFGFVGPGEREARQDLVRFEHVIRDAEARAAELLHGYPDKDIPGKFVPVIEPIDPPRVEVRR